MTPKASTTRGGWVLQLRDQRDLEFWAKCFPQRPVHIFAQAGIFYCEADALDKLTDEHCAFERGTELLQTAYAVLRLWKSNVEPVEVSFIMKRDADGSWGQPAGFASISCQGWISSIGYVEGHTNQAPAEMFVDLAARDERVKSALDDFASPSLNMSCLRRIAETIWTEFDSSSQKRATEKMNAAGLAEKQSLDQFLQTVNRGKEGAHSHFRFEKYADSMLLGEAQEFLARLLEQWIRSKFQDSAT